MIASSFRPALIAFACIMLAASLGGCGRKGHLDLPPQPQAQAGPSGTAAAEDLGPGSVVDPSLTDDELPTAPQGTRKRKFILDPLLAD